jgi:hypothetical protein
MNRQGPRHYEVALRTIHGEIHEKILRYDQRPTWAAEVRTLEAVVWLPCSVIASQLSPRVPRRCRKSIPESREAVLLDT